MPKVEEADIILEKHMEKLFESITSVKSLSLLVGTNSGEESQFKFHDGIFFNQLEHLKLCISFDYWSKLLFQLLQNSPKLRVLKLYVDCDGRFNKYKSVSWSSVPECLLESLETFEFAGYSGRPEERDFVSFIIKNARRLKSSSITPPA
uniref:FBD-associated F-box protein n=1 Tax=Noccaea caerulescens TaxID=107243 RepID=A0A1J3J9M4_NOCCA